MDDASDSGDELEVDLNAIRALDGTAVLVPDRESNEEEVAQEALRRQEQEAADAHLARTLSQRRVLPARPGVTGTRLG